MGRKGQISLETKNAIVCLLKDGVPSSKILDAFSISKASLSRIRKNMNSPENLKPKTHPGRPRIFSNREERLFVRFALSNKFFPISDITTLFSKYYNLTISRKTATRILKRHFIHSRIARRKPYTTAKIRFARKLYCKNHLSWKSSDWNKVIFTDETFIRLDEAMRTRVICRGGGQYLAENTINVRIPGRKGVMFWGAIGGGKKLQFFEVQNTMNSHKYLNYMNENCMNLINCVGGINQVWWMHDNALSHRAKTVKKYFSENHIKILGWPVYSPDLNPIENHWLLLKKNVSKRCPRTTSELIKIAKEEWEKIPIKYVEK